MPPTPPKRRRFQMTETGLGIRGHGNWCGPNYSGGEFQGSVINNVVAIDGLDSQCKVHDGEYATNGTNLAKADMKFAIGSILEGGKAAIRGDFKTAAKGLVFGGLVGAQGIARSTGLMSMRNVLAQSKKTHKSAAPGQSFFPIVKIGKRKRMPPRRRTSRRKFVAKRKRSVYRKRSKYNKKRSTYRRKRRYNRRTLRRRGKVNTVTTVKETGGTISEPTNCAFIGHGTSAQPIMEILFMSLIKKLFKAHGISINNFTEAGPDNTNSDFRRFAIYLYYQQSGASTVQTQSNIFTESTDTYYSIAMKLRDQFYVDTAIAKPPVLRKLLLREQEYVEPDWENRIEVATVDLSTMLIDLGYYSSVRIQNQTANGSNGATVDSNNTNPLQGRVYMGKLGKNYFPVQYKTRPDQPDYIPWIARNDFGQILDRSSNHTGDNSFNELVPGWTVGAYKTKDFVLHPGQVLMDTISYRKKFHVQTLMNKLIEELTNGAASDKTMLNLGIARVYGFDKLVWDRSELNPVKLAFEYNVKYTMNITGYTVKSVPYVDIETDGIFVPPIP